eukprot:TRINITY_DN2781_c0_g1_i1.p9 TRINITY_DN2781_c0_g1~~TRINITY_DN2781_c0_g1_i1.p9  ORF type:complete len:269 (+),score=59.86 TRINITY_DN2781_c0_g1_i1:4173-4979(+)
MMKDKMQNGHASGSSNVKSSRKVTPNGTLPPSQNRPDVSLHSNTSDSITSPGKKAEAVSAPSTVANSLASSYADTDECKSVVKENDDLKKLFKAKNEELEKLKEEMQETIERLEDECKTALFAKKKVEWEKASVEKSLAGKLQLLDKITEEQKALQEGISELNNKLREQKLETEKVQAQHAKTLAELQEKTALLSQIKVNKVSPEEIMEKANKCKEIEAELRELYKKKQDTAIEVEMLEKSLMELKNKHKSLTPGKSFVKQEMDLCIG